MYMFLPISHPEGDRRLGGAEDLTGDLTKDLSRDLTRDLTGDLTEDLTRPLKRPHMRPHKRPHKRTTGAPRSVSHSPPTGQNAEKRREEEEAANRSSQVRFPLPPFSHSHHASLAEHFPVGAACALTPQPPIYVWPFKNIINNAITRNYALTPSLTRSLRRLTPAYANQCCRI